MPQTKLSAAVQAAAIQLGINNVSAKKGLAALILYFRMSKLQPLAHKLRSVWQVSNDDVIELCTELAEGTVLPAGWSKGYDTQRNRLYFVDEVLTDVQF